MATIVWTEDENQVDTHHGTVGGVEYFLIHPRYGIASFNLHTTVPCAIGADPYAQTVDELKARADDVLAEFLSLVNS